MTSAEPLGGGRVTPGVVRIGETVRRPVANPFAHELLRRLEAAGFDAAPRFLGIDEEGREILSWIEGSVPPELEPDWPDETLAAAARLVRRFHDAVPGVCHNDLSPCNFVFRDECPVAIIDWDDAAPGRPEHDLAYALFLWLDLNDGGPPLAEQRRRMRVFLDSYGRAEVPPGLIVEVVRGHPVNDWWRLQAEWLDAHREELRL
jgi:Ser/Thr protein kinase RdoA (MazF antagonist)